MLIYDWATSSIALCILVMFWYIFLAFNTSSVLSIRRTSLLCGSPLRCLVALIEALKDETLLLWDCPPVTLNTLARGRIPIEKQFRISFKRKKEVLNTLEGNMFPMKVMDKDHSEKNHETLQTTTKKATTRNKNQNISS